MPDRRRHRGAAPEDAKIFAPDAVLRLRRAVEELSWLRSRGYPRDSSLSLVGNRHALVKRQRAAVGRASCSDDERSGRRARCLQAVALAGREIWIDGYNVLTTVESALAGGVVLCCRDGFLRDMASMHGSWRRVEETKPALRRIDAVLRELEPCAVRWLFDEPVSGSGKLKGMLRELFPSSRVDLVRDPDRDFHQAHARGLDIVVASADSGVLDCGVTSVGLAALVVAEIEGAWLVDLSAG